VPSENAHNAIQTLRDNFGIDASAHVPRAVGQLDLSPFDLIVAIDDPGGSQVYKSLKERGVSDKTLIKWKVTDPWDGDDPSQYNRCALETVKNLERLKKVLALS
jgi:protein-tyrosine-phosphatase